MIPIYIISLIVLMIVLYFIYKQAKLVFMGWHKLTDAGSSFMRVFAFIACTCAIVCWLFLIYWTFSSWQISLDPSRPKPFFLVIYILGLFVVGISMSLSQLFLSLSKLKNDAE